MIVVTAGVIRLDGRLLITRRAPGQKHAGLWEFPGGKAEPDETPERTLERELREELGICAQVGRLLFTVEQSSATGPVRFLFYAVDSFTGRIRLTDHDQSAWISEPELRNYSFTPADIVFVDRLLAGDLSAAPAPLAMFDAHCHLQDERLVPNIVTHLQAARGIGVTGFACCGSSEDDWSTVRELALLNPDVHPSFGLHPWYVRNRSSAWKDTLETFLKSMPQAGIGEIGLDHAIRERDDVVQAGVLREQLELASRFERPASMHCRQAWGALAEVLADIQLPRGFVIHSYSGSAELVEAWTGRGAYFSFSGTITRSNNTRGHAAVRAVPLDRLLIETDAPDLMPVLPGTPSATGEKPVNEPANLIHVLRKVAQLRNMSELEVAHLTRRNARRLFLGQSAG